MPTDTTSVATWRSLAETDPEIAAVLRDERQRQNNGLELIASENFVSRAVLEAAGSVLTNKYAEGYPGRRYYGGCEFVDVAERAAIARAKALFGADHVNVQPHSGAQANMSVYLTLLKPGDTVLGMNLAHGGHLTHGHPLNFSGQAVHDRPLRRAQGRRADRLRRARPARGRAQAEDDHRRRQRLSARHRFRADPRRRESGRRGDVHRHGAHRRPRRGRRAIRAPCRTPTSCRRRRTRRCADRAAGWCCAASSTPRTSIEAVFPGVQGGPLMHIIAAKAVCFKEAGEAGLRGLPATDRRQRRPAGAGALRRRLPAGQRRHRQSPDARRRVLEGHHRQGGRGGARQGRHHGQQERDSVRSESSDGRERHPRRHAGGHHARHARSGDGCHRRAHRSRAQDSGRRRRARRWSGRKSNGCAGSSRCTRKCRPERRRP